MPLAQKILPNYTYDDYCRWKGRWELIEGIAFDMSPMASPRHQRIASKLNTILDVALSNDSCNCEVYQPIDVKIEENTVVNPDLLIVCKPIEKQYIDFAPSLVVEIISPSSKMKDRYTKYDLYRDFGIKYYVLIDPEEQTVEVFQLDEKGDYKLMVSPYQFVFENDCTICPDLSKLF